MSFEEGQRKARDLGLLFYETSARLSLNINEMLEQVAFFLSEIYRVKSRRVLVSE